MRCQSGTASRRNVRYLPYAFTEHGALMAANVLSSPRAVEMRGQLDTVAGTPHLCGSGPAKSNALPDKSGVPSATRQLRLSLCPVAPEMSVYISPGLLKPFF